MSSKFHPVEFGSAQDAVCQSVVAKQLWRTGAGESLLSPLPIASSFPVENVINCISLRRQLCTGEIQPRTDHVVATLGEYALPAMPCRSEIGLTCSLPKS
jgi:hypothetical protein